MSDSITEAFQKFIRSSMAAVDYFAHYSGEVLRQHADGTVDVQCSDARLPGFTKLEVRWGGPGVVAKLKANARVMVGFRDGDPRRAFVSGFAFDGADEVLLGGETGDGSDATEKAVKGSAYRQHEKQMHNDLASKLGDLSAQLASIAGVFAGIAGTGSAPVLGSAFAGLATPFAAAVAAAAQASSTLAQYEAQAATRGDDLSVRVKLK